MYSALSTIGNAHRFAKKRRLVVASLRAAIRFEYECRDALPRCNLHPPGHSYDEGISNGKIIFSREAPVPPPTPAQETRNIYPISAKQNKTADEAAKFVMLGPYLQQTPPSIEKGMDYYSSKYERGWACFIRRIVHRWQNDTQQQYSLAPEIRAYVSLNSFYQSTETS